MTEEGNVKKAICDYLEICHQQGKLYWLRLNSGKAWMRYKGNDKLYPIQLCEAGMPDLMIFGMEKFQDTDIDGVFYVRLIFFEVKSSKGDTSDIQKERHAELREYGAEVYTVKSLDEVMEILDNGTKGE